MIPRLRFRDFLSIIWISWFGCGSQTVDLYPVVCDTTTIRVEITNDGSSCRICHDDAGSECVCVVPTQAEDCES